MNLYEKIQKMSLDDMADFFVFISVCLFFTVFGFTHIPSKEFIKSMPQYEESFNASKKFLLEEHNGESIHSTTQKDDEKP
jgi:hypothetical protein